jgi:uncharacterized coiled-coil protein SlyX
MSTEERVTILEQGLAGVKSDFLVHLSENNRQIAAFNRVLSSQELNGRDVDHNLTILLGVTSEQGRDIKAVKERLEGVESRLGGIESRLDGIGQHLSSLELGIQQVLQQLSTLTKKPE